MVIQGRECAGICQNVLQLFLLATDRLPHSQVGGPGDMGANHTDMLKEGFLRSHLAMAPVFAACGHWRAALAVA